MRNIFFLSCLIFLLFLFLFPANPEAMFSDPDSWWHVAAGDIIRSSGAIPAHDLWSFTAGNVPWLNISWGWDVAASYLLQHSGWYGVIVANSIIIAATLALIFAASYVRSHDGIAAFIVTTIIAVLMFRVTLRPYQFSFLLVAAFAFLLAQIANRACSPKWLMLVPVMMVVWVNSHGEFLTAFFFLGIYFIEAFRQKDARLAAWLAGCGIASLLACLINPYGIHMIDAALRTIDSDVKPIITEWQPMNFSSGFRAAQIYLGLFLLLVIMRPATTTRTEKWIAYSWLALGLISVRHLGVFAIVSAPPLAVGVRDALLPKSPPPERLPFVKALCAGALRFSEARKTAWGMGIITLLLAIWIFTPSAMRLYNAASFNPPLDVSAEVAFIEQHYPKAHFLNSYELGGPLIFEARGKVPVFIDGRAETAYPKDVIRDYVAFHSEKKDWDAMLDRYHIDGAIITSVNEPMMDRFTNRSGWHLVYAGKTASVFMRDKR